MLGEKKYERAIKKKETIDFLLGIGEYHHPDGEFSSEFHTPSYTFLEIKEYGTKHGEVKMLKQFKDDIKKALRLDLTSDEFLTISTYIYIYMLGFYKENSIKIEWIPDEETRTLIKKHYNNFMDQFSSLIKMNFNNQFPKQNEGFFLRNIVSEYKFMKERFGVDLLV